MPDPQYLEPVVPIEEPMVMLGTNRVTPIWHRFFAGRTQVRALTGTHAQRLASFPPGDHTAGTMFFETDRGVLYVVDGGAWKPVKGGQMQAAFAGAPADLGANDAGFLLYVTDFAHLVRWTGAAWEFADGGNAFFQDFAVAPGTGWALCDGSATTYLAVGAALSAQNFNTPASTTTPHYRKSAAAYTGALLAASGVSDPHSHVVDPHEHGNERLRNGTTATGVTSSVTVDANLDGTTASAAPGTHAHPTVTVGSGYNINTDAASPNTDAKTVGPGSLDMPRLGALPYFRR